MISGLLFTIATTLTLPPLQSAELPDFTLESGEVLIDARIGYRTMGELDPEKSNAVLFPSWFGGTSEHLFQTGSADLVDTERFFLIAVDAFGNGVSTSPSNSAQAPFPSVTIGDMVRAQYVLLTERLGITQLHAVMGISMGGMPGPALRFTELVGGTSIALGNDCGHVALFCDTTGDAKAAIRRFLER